ncbi:MAG TPA: hypothetical protein VF507_01790, partial [Pyrinomonadaceae bacterium]
MMNKLLAAVALTLALFGTGVMAQDGHEYAPVQEKAVNYKAWSYKSLKDDSQVELRSLLKGKKLVMVVYFAPWCP